MFNFQDECCCFKFDFSRRFWQFFFIRSLGRSLLVFFNLTGWVGFVDGNFRFGSLFFLWPTLSLYARIWPNCQTQMWYIGILLYSRDRDEWVSRPQQQEKKIEIELKNGFVSISTFASLPLYCYCRCDHQSNCETLIDFCCRRRRRCWTLRFAFLISIHDIRPNSVCLCLFYFFMVASTKTKSRECHLFYENWFSQLKLSERLETNGFCMQNLTYGFHAILPYSALPDLHGCESSFFKTTKIFAIIFTNWNSVFADGPRASDNRRNINISCLPEIRFDRFCPPTRPFVNLR